MKENVLAFWTRHRRILVYCVVGGCTTLVNMALFTALYYGAHFNENAANVTAVVASVIFAYITNKIYVFQTHCPTASDFVREMLTFFAARGLTMLIEVGGGYLLMTLMGMEAWICKVLLICVVLVLNYVFSRLLVFKT